MSRPIPAIADESDDNPDTVSPQAAAELIEPPQIHGFGMWTPVSESRFDAYAGTDIATFMGECNANGRTYQGFFLAQPE